MSAEGRQILRRTVSERQWTLAERLAYMDCMRTLGWRCEGTRWVSTVHRAPVCVFILTPPPPPTRPLTNAYRLKRSQSAYRAFHQELWKTLQIFDMPKTLRDPLRSPTTPDDHQRPTTVIWRPSSDLQRSSCALGSVPGLGGLKETKNVSSPPTCESQYCGEPPWPRGSVFESCVWRTVSSQSSHHPQEVLLAQFSLYVHKGGLKPDSFHFISFRPAFFPLFMNVRQFFSRTL